MMKQEVFIQITAPFEGTIRTREVFQNLLEEKLVIHNVCISRVFEDPVLEDGKDRRLPAECIPVHNGRDYYYAAKLVEPVLPGRKYVVKMLGRLSGEYFTSTTVRKEELFFWQIHHASAMPSELVFRVSLADCFELVHVQGPDPASDEPGTFEWECSLGEGRSFHPLVVYREKQPRK